MPYPAGLSGSGITVEQLAQALRKRLTLLLGGKAARACISLLGRIHAPVVLRA
jgi:hypothetical protein